MKRIFFGIVALLLTASCGYCQEAEQPFQLTIRSDKQVYGVGEDIIIEVVQKNKSDQDVLLEDYYPKIDEIGHRSKFRFTVYKDKSNTPQQYIHYEQLAKMLVNFQNRQMKPGEEFVFKVTLNKWYDMLSPGRYSIGCMKTHQFPKVKLQEEQLPIGKKEMFQVKAVTYVSNTLTIEVREKGIDKVLAVEIAKKRLLSESFVDSIDTERVTVGFRKEQNVYWVDFAWKNVSEIMPWPRGYYVVVDASTGEIKEATAYKR